MKLLKKKIEENKSIIIDLCCVLSNINEIVKTSMLNKTPILIIEIKTRIEVCKLLDFIKVQSSKKQDVVLSNNKVWEAFYNQYKKLDYKTIPCIRHIEFPLLLDEKKELWFDFCY